MKLELLNILSILTLILDGGLIVFLIIHFIKHRNIVNKENIAFFAIGFSVALFIGIVGAIYGSNASLLNIIKIIGETLGVFAFKPFTDFCKNAINDSLLFTIAYGITIIICSLSFFSGIILAFANVIRNKKSIKNAKNKKHDYVIGYNNESFDYLRKNDGLLILDKTEKLTSIEEKKLLANKIPYIYISFSSKPLARLLKNEENIFITFDKGHLDTLANILLPLSKEKAKRVLLYSLVDDNDYDTVNLTYDNEEYRNEEFFSIRLFALKTLTALSFTNKYNLAEFLPDGFIDNICTVNKDINVNMIGMDSINSELLEALISNNQFVHLNNNQYEPHLVTYNIFPNDKNKYGEKVFKNIQANQDDVDKNKKRYAPLICNYNNVGVSISSNEFHEKINSLLSSDGMNYFVVNDGEDSENIKYSDIIEEICMKAKCNYHIFVRLKERKYAPWSRHVSIFGNIDEIKTRKNIVELELFKFAASISDRYLDLKKTTSDSLNSSNGPLVERLSSFYAGLNAPFKLALMNIRIANINEIPLGYEIFDYNNYIDYLEEGYGDYFAYKSYFGINRKCSLAHIEKLRWNSYYYLNGYTSMPLEVCEERYKEAIKNNGKIGREHIDHTNKQHACIASHQDLDKFHQLKAKYKNVDIKDAETYRYDLMTLGYVLKNALDADNKVLVRKVK